MVPEAKRTIICPWSSLSIVTGAIFARGAWRAPFRPRGHFRHRPHQRQRAIDHVGRQIAHRALRTPVTAPVGGCGGIGKEISVCSPRNQVTAPIAPSASSARTNCVAGVRT